MDRVLNVGAVIDTQTPPAWIVNLAEKVEEHANLKLIGVVLNTTGPASTPTPPQGILAKLAKWILLRQIDKPLFSQNPWKASAVETDTNTQQPTDNQPYFGYTETQLQGCDVILNLTHSPLPGGLIGHNNIPIWCAHVETLDARVEESLLHQAPLLWIHLWANNSSESGVERIASHALPRQTYSITDLRRAAYFSLPALFESRLNWFARGIDLTAQEIGRQDDLPAQVREEYRSILKQAADLQAHHQLPPSSQESAILRRVISLWWRQSVDRIAGRIWYDQWQLATIKQSNTGSNPVQQLTQTPVEQYTALPTPDKTWWADPHLYQHEKALYVFFEEMHIDSSRGHLSVAKLDADGQVSQINKVLEDEKHLSYPFVFTHEEQAHMIPETASRKTVSLYRAQQFPDKWEHVCDLLSDVDLADTTLCYMQDRWWMFTNSQSHPTVNERDELRIFHAETLTGPWHPHPLNPVITGVHRARMAGPMISDGQFFYRPSQYGAKRYGYGINLNRIDVLNTDVYAETPVARIIPDASTPWLGCHSIARMNDITVLDRVRRRRR